LYFFKKEPVFINKVIDEILNKEIDAILDEPEYL